MNIWGFVGIFIYCLQMFISSAEAAELASYCFVKDDNKSKIEGESLDKKFPIASVSKVVTSYWSILTSGPNYQFETHIYVKATEAHDVFDLYIEGSRDPYFGKESLHYMISILNSSGIKKIRNFYFDENFKFYWDVTSGKVAVGHYNLNSPSQNTVKSELTKNKTLTTGYEVTKKLAQSLGITLYNDASLTVANFQPVEKKLMNLSGSFFQFSIKSSQLIKLVKEMNRNSNNHAANQIFETFGGADAFQFFVLDRLKLTPENIEFVNGSGDRFDIEGGKSKYNTATCRAMLTILRDFRTALKSQGKDLEDVLAVAGVGNNTLTRFTNDMTIDSLVAKTGFVSPARTLAGLLSTAQGDVLFMYNFALDGTTKDRDQASDKIRLEITKLVKKHGGPVEVHGKSAKFISFDAESSVETTTSEKNIN